MHDYMRLLNQRPIAYYPVYRDITRSTVAAVLLSQLMYWLSKKDEIFKTDAEIMEETKLTHDELKTAKAKIKHLSFISVERRGLPAKTYYSIDWEKYEETLRNLCVECENDEADEPEYTQTSLGESHKLDCGNPTNSTVEIPQTYNDKSFDRDYTEITTETTTPLNSPPRGKSKKSGGGKQKKTATAEDAKAYAEEKEFGYALNESSYAEWLKYRSAKRKPVSVMAMQKQVSLLCRYDEATQKAIVDRSIANDYQGLFEPKSERGSIGLESADYSEYEKFGYVPPEKRGGVIDG